MRVPKKGSKLRLGYTGGCVHPYEDCNVPDLLQIPLKVHPQGFLEGKSSNKRSALYEVDRVLFKQKGARPCKIPHCYFGDPYGGMSAAKSKNELKINELLTRLYKEHGFKHALEPVADVEYEIPFNGEKVHANIHKCNGDWRLDDVVKAIEKSIVTKPSVIDPKYLRDLCRGLYSWYGFANRIIDENHIVTHFDSGLSSNFVVHDVGGGYGIARIDHGSSKLVDHDVKRKERSFSNELNTIPMCMVLTDISLESGMPLSVLSKRHDMEIKYVDPGHERIDAEKPIVFLSRERFKLLEKANDIFYEFYESNKKPKPIREKLLHSFI